MAADEEEFEVEEVSDEEKLQIAQHYLLNAPPGQFDEVLKDVKALLPEGLIGDPMLAGLARAFNTKCFRAIKNGDSKLILCEAAEVDVTHYMEPKSGKILGVNHVTGEPVDGDVADMAGPMEPALEDMRSAVDNAVADYVSSQYMPGSGVSGVYAKGNVLTVVVSGEKLNLRNFWSGMWLSVWTATVDPAGVQVSGEIKIRAHYFEDGNVQLQSKKAVESVTLPQTAPDQVARAVADHIKTEEKMLQDGLEEMYVNMTDETFKAMRRKMPITQTKMNWNINEVKLNSNLTAGK